MEEYIHQSNLIEDINSEKADEQSIKAWKWLEKRKTITEAVVKELHGKITESQASLRDHERGQYRVSDVMVGGRLCPSWRLVPELMNNWFLDFRMKEPIINHVFFEKIHPFADGNGRTGRMLMWWQEKNIGQKPTLIKLDERQDYYQWFTN